MKNNKEKDSSDKYLYIFFKIAATLLVISISFPFIVNHFFADWGKSGTFGDTFGALNALFSGLAFAGVIVTILIQKSELKLQRDEMQDTRKEFLINRTTNLVYNQLDRFEKCLSELTISHNGKTYKGNDAISFLDDNKETVYKPFDKSDEDHKAEMKAAIIKLLQLYTPNKSQIEKFAYNAYNSVEVLKRLIYKTELEVEELNDIKNLFFVNIGFVSMGVIERISDVGEKELKYLAVEDYDGNNIDVGKMTRTNIFLKPIKLFYHQRLTKENFDRLKSDWVESQRGLA